MKLKDYAEMELESLIYAAHQCIALESETSLT